MAPTLCGSVTWSSTINGRPAALLGELCQRRLGQRLGLDQRALMHGVGPQAPVEVPGSTLSCAELRAPPAPRCSRRSALSVRSSLRIVALRVGERRFHRMDAEDQRRPVASLRRAPVRCGRCRGSVSGMCGLRRAGIRAHVAHAMPAALRLTGNAPAITIYTRATGPAGDGGAILFGDGGVPEWLKGTDCKSVGFALRWFESNALHQPRYRRGVPELAKGDGL